MGIRDGLALAKKHGIHDKYVKSDAKEAIDLIVKEPRNNITLMPLISDCKKLLLNFKIF